MKTAITPITFEDNIRDIIKSHKSDRRDDIAEIFK
jgi:hypothetical protein